MKSLILNYITEVGNTLLGIFPFIISRFSEKPLINQEIEEKIKKPEDKEKFYEAIEELKKSNSTESKTIELSNGEKMTIIIR